MRCSSTWTDRALSLGAACLLAGWVPGSIAGQIPGSAIENSPVPRAALPIIPYWWPLFPANEIDAIPLAWYNDVDGTVVGAAARHRVGHATIWWGLGLGLDSDGTTPAAAELAAEVSGGFLTLRRLHGRNAVTLRSKPISSYQGATLSIGVAGTWLEDDRYLESIPLFECSASAPALPCQESPQPYSWSPGRDHAMELEGRWGEPRGREVVLQLAGGLKVAGGDHEYLRAELVGKDRGELGTLTWSARFAGGWASGASPRQRRFYLHDVDPLTRWLNPLVEAQGALLADIPYFVGGGPHLRAYTEARPLVKRYLGLAAELGRTIPLRHGLWVRAAGFLEAAWTPALPDRVGPEGLHGNGALLFDWRELPDGEGEAQGRFRARALEVSQLWADGGVALTGGFRGVSLTLSAPLWANQAEFANEPIVGDPSPVAARWAVTITVRSAPPPGLEP